MSFPQPGMSPKKIFDWLSTWKTCIIFFTKANFANLHICRHWVLNGDIWKKIWDTFGQRIRGSGGYICTRSTLDVTCDVHMNPEAIRKLSGLSEIVLEDKFCYNTNLRDLFHLNHIVTKLCGSANRRPSVVCFSVLGFVFAMRSISPIIYEM